MESWSWNIENEDYLNKTIERCKKQKIILPKFSQLKNPATIPQSIQKKLEKVGLEDVNPLNLFRINWRNDTKTGRIGEINFL